MEKEIINNIYHLYRNHIVTLVIFVLLGCVAILMSIWAIKAGVMKKNAHQILLLTIVILCSITLPIIQIIQMIPIRKDYKETSYVILQNATLTIITDATGVIDFTNQVTVVDSDKNNYNFKIQSDFNLDRGESYVGTIVYLKHSGFVIWYSLNP